MAGTLTLLDDLVTNTGGTLTVDSTGELDLTGGDTINNGQFNNAGTVKVTNTGNKIENETGGTAYTVGTNSLTNTGTLEVAGTLTLLDDLRDQHRRHADGGLRLPARWTRDRRRHHQ